MITPHIINRSNQVTSCNMTFTSIFNLIKRILLESSAYDPKKNYNDNNFYTFMTFVHTLLSLSTNSVTLIIIPQCYFWTINKYNNWILKPKKKKIPTKETPKLLESYRKLNYRIYFRTRQVFNRRITKHGMFWILALSNLHGNSYRWEQ